MSDYDVTLVNNKMSEFFVKFKGPSESMSRRSFSVVFEATMWRGNEFAHACMKEEALATSSLIAAIQIRS